MQINQFQLLYVSGFNKWVNVVKLWSSIANLIRWKEWWLYFGPVRTHSFIAGGYCKYINLGPGGDTPRQHLIIALWVGLGVIYVARGFPGRNSGKTLHNFWTYPTYALGGILKSNLYAKHIFTALAVWGKVDFNVFPCHISLLLIYLLGLFCNNTLL